MDSKQQKIDQFDPNGVGVRNGNFIGLPFTEEEADVILQPMPWDVTVSYSDGTSRGPENILEASYQLDLLDPVYPDAWKCGYYFEAPNEKWQTLSRQLRKKVRKYIHFLENEPGSKIPKKLQKVLSEVNEASGYMNEFVYQRTTERLENNKIVGHVGGDHSTPLGYYQALANYYGEFGLLVLDAHMDLRDSYEGFKYSHASIFYNALAITNLTKLVQVGIRDYCQAEKELADSLFPRVEVYYDKNIRTRMYKELSFDAICDEIVDKLPQQVAISVDIDGLDPRFCPNTGTPVPGGLDFNEACYLLEKIVEKGKTIIGFDLCEVAGIPHEWDGNVGARILYKLGNLCLKSRVK